MENSGLSKHCGCQIFIHFPLKFPHPCPVMVCFYCARPVESRPDSMHPRQEVSSGATRGTFQQKNARVTAQYCIYDHIMNHICTLMSLKLIDYKQHLPTYLLSYLSVRVNSILHQRHLGTSWDDSPHQGLLAPSV